MFNAATGFLCSLAVLLGAISFAAGAAGWSYNWSPPLALTVSYYVVLGLLALHGVSVFASTTRQQYAALKHLAQIYRMRLQLAASGGHEQAPIEKNFEPSDEQGRARAVRLLYNDADEATALRIANYIRSLSHLSLTDVAPTSRVDDFLSWIGPDDLAIVVYSQSFVTNGLIMSDIEKTAQKDDTIIIILDESSLPPAISNSQAIYLNQSEEFEFMSMLMDATYKIARRGDVKLRRRQSKAQAWASHVMLWFVLLHIIGSTSYATWSILIASQSSSVALPFIGELQIESWIFGALGIFSVFLLIFELALVVVYVSFALRYYSQLAPQVMGQSRPKKAHE